jgi:hypothetical protein
LSNKNITVCPHPPYSPDLALCYFWLFPKVKMTLKGKRFESIQDIEAATTAQLKTLTKRTSRTASESGKNDGINVFEARGSILRGINGNVSFIVIHFLNLNIHRIFLSHLVFGPKHLSLVNAVKSGARRQPDALSVIQYAGTALSKARCMSRVK